MLPRNGLLMHYLRGKAHWYRFTFIANGLGQIAGSGSNKTVNKYISSQAGKNSTLMSFPQRHKVPMTYVFTDTDTPVLPAKTLQIQQIWGESQTIFFTSKLKPLREVIQCCPVPHGWTLRSGESPPTPGSTEAIEKAGRK